MERERNSKRRDCIDTSSLDLVECQRINMDTHADILLQPRIFPWNLRTPAALKEVHRAPRGRLRDGPRPGDRGLQGPPAPPAQLAQAAFFSREFTFLDIFLSLVSIFFSPFLFETTCQCAQNYLTSGNHLEYPTIPTKFCVKISAKHDIS